MNITDAEFHSIIVWCETTGQNKEKVLEEYRLFKQGEIEASEMAADIITGRK
jgi:hypothetical protein